MDVDWGAAVEAAQRQGEGFGPVRGLKRLGVRVFGGEVAPTSRVYQSAVDAYMGRFARGVDEASVEPSLVLRGSEPEIVPGRNGRLLDRAMAEKVFIQALTALSRQPVAVPLKVDRTHLATQDLVGAKVKAETALSGPVDVAYGPGAWHLTVAKITRLLELPSNGDTELRLAGPRATTSSRTSRGASTTLRKTRPSPSAHATSSVSSPPSRAGRWTCRRRRAT